jgi:hypothetical protein
MALPDELWPDVGRLVSAGLRTPVGLIERLGRPRDNTVTWAADAEGLGSLVVKARLGDRGAEKVAWAAGTLPLLASRGYPVPDYLWHGALHPSWYVLVQRRLPGHPPRVPDGKVLDQLLALVELQAEAGIDPGPRDMAAYQALVLFEGWDHVWRDAEAASAESRRLCARIRRMLRPVWGRRLEARDFAHGDLNLANVLTDGSAITGIVDWDEFGLNSRAADLASIVFDLRRLSAARDPGPVADAAMNRLLELIAAVAGEPGLRVVLAYAAVTRLATAHRRRQPEALSQWEGVADHLLAMIGEP